MSRKPGHDDGRRPEAPDAPETDKTATGPLFDRLQTIVLLALVALFAAGLFVFRHRQQLSAQPIVLTEGDASGYEFTIDINTAAWEEIALLPGIGEQKARAIVSYREENGPFETAEDLTAVEGIGEKTAAAAAGYLNFDGGAL
jgi:competence ComEA-like helix-hairpin-helix protein